MTSTSGASCPAVSPRPSSPPLRAAARRTARGLSAAAGTGAEPVLTVHVVRAPGADAEAVLAAVRGHCERELRIGHATVQVEAG